MTGKAIAFAAARAGATGVYISLSCYYDDVAPFTRRSHCSTSSGPAASQ